MTWEYTAEEYKAYTRETWNESVDAYAAWVRALEPFTDHLIDTLDPRPGEQILDVASGRGEPALSLAKEVAPEGTVLGIDLADEMIDQARQAAKQAGCSNVRFEVMDAEDMDLEDGSFDAVSCRSSLQIFTDPASALEGIARVLRPGGRFAASVWAAPGERSPALHAILGPMLMYCTPDATGYLPTPYELGGPGTLASMVEDVGLEVDAEKRIRVPLEFRDIGSFMEAMLNGTPVGHSLKEEDEDIQQAVLRETRQNVDRWNQADDRIILDSEAVVISARKPS